MWRDWAAVTPFSAPRQSLGRLDAEAAATLIAAAADLVIIIDRSGVVRDIAVHADDLAAQLRDPARWRGQSWLATLTAESRAKAEALMQEAAAGTAPRWRQLNHPALAGPDIPLLYSAVGFGAEGQAALFGRDLRALSEMQQRLVAAQQSMERDYARTRQFETRYRLLFHLASDAVLILDAAGQKVLEENPAARLLFGAPPSRGSRPLADLFAAASLPLVTALLGAVRAAGRADDVTVQLADGSTAAASASLFREGSVSLFLLRIVPVQPVGTTVAVPKLKSKLLKLVESAPDGFVVTAMDGRIVTANAAFLDMAQLSSEEQARGESLDRWLGRPGVDLDVLTANLRQGGTVRLFATTLRGEHGVPAEVEISAVTVMNGGGPCCGFAIRNVGRRLSAAAPGSALPHPIERMTELVGSVALKDLVREATDVIERLCIEAALRLTNDNRASAAEMLGLSRQSLYVKLRRYGLGDAAEVRG